MKALKSILVWILLLALPLQGFAAVSMSMCEMDSVKAAVVAESVQDCEHHAASQPADESSPGGTAKCGAASCSVGAAIFTAFEPMAQCNSHGAERIPYVGAYDTDCIYGALERPPHSFS